MEYQDETSKDRKKIIFRLKRRGITLLVCFLSFTIAAFFAVDWISITQDFEKNRSEKILSSETSVKNAEIKLSEEIFDIKNIDLFYSKIYGNISLQEMGEVISALKPSLHGILQIQQGDITYYVHSIEEKAFDKSMERFAGNEGTENGDIHFFSESYGKTRDYLEAAHTVRIKNSRLIFIYGIDNSYLWHIERDTELRTGILCMTLLRIRLFPTRFLL